MRPIRELCAEVDQALAQVGMTLTNDGFIKRTYAGTLDGMPLRAELSVMAEQGSVPRFETGVAVGYSLTIACDNGLPTRWVMGRDIPVLLGVGLPWVANITEKALLRADDSAWAARFLTGDAKPAFATLGAQANFVEQRPGVLQLQLRDLTSTAVPALAPLLQAFATVSRVSQQAPPPRPAQARLSDNRGLLVGLITFAVLAVMTVCGGLATWLWLR